MSRLGDIQLINQLISQVIIILPSQLFVALISITVIAFHRPRVISRADWIVLMDGGKVKTQGFYQSLIEQPGEHLEFLSP